MTKLCRSWWGAAVLVLLSSTARGQTAVQLPTYSFFGVGTTVSVPDRGSTYLGGINRASSGSNQFGTPIPLPGFQNRSFGLQRSAMNTSVSVYVHDFEAMDEFLLSQPTAFQRSRGQSSFQVAGAVRREVMAEESEAIPAGQPGVDVAALRAQRMQEQQARGGELLELLKRGQEAESAGKMSVARLYYQMVARRAEGDLKSQALVRLQTVSGIASPKLAQGHP